ncbi:GyrI-like domain-containing protein [Marinomonas dokdonensis]|uniref:GyrI-like domain-containing protein n=1 Tax=Marinomonas dokdonensis TaxID=328224 RepID=UPI0040555A6C
MILVHRKEKQLSGIVKRIENKSALQNQSDTIEALHYSFIDSVNVDYSQGARLYGVYHHYQNGLHGDYSIFVGTDTDHIEEPKSLTQMTIPEGKYLVFSGHGEMPLVVMEVWESIWHYFEQADCKFERAFEMDFEYYRSKNTVIVYVSVNNIEAS